MQGWNCASFISLLWLMTCTVDAWPSTWVSLLTWQSGVSSFVPRAAGTVGFGDLEMGPGINT